MNFSDKIVRWAAAATGALLVIVFAIYGFGGGAERAQTEDATVETAEEDAETADAREETEVAEEAEAPDETETAEDPATSEDAEMAEQDEAAEEAEAVEETDMAEDTATPEGAEMAEQDEAVEEAEAVEETDMAEDSATPEDAQMAEQDEAVEETDMAEDTANGELAELIEVADLANGERIWAQCNACHVYDGEQNQVGPHLVNVIGRDIAAVDGFNYSGALADLSGAWTADVLDIWLEAPQEFAPGNRMGFAGLDDADDRRDVIGFLADVAHD